MIKVRIFRHHIYVNHFKVVTDHLHCAVWKIKGSEVRLEKWLLCWQGYISPLYIVLVLNTRTQRLFLTTNPGHPFRWCGLPLYVVGTLQSPEKQDRSHPWWTEKAQCYHPFQDDQLIKMIGSIALPYIPLSQKVSLILQTHHFTCNGGFLKAHNYLSNQ